MAKRAQSRYVLLVFTILITGIVVHQQFVNKSPNKALAVTTPVEIILDNAPAGQSGGGRSFTGTWCKSTSAGYYGTDSLYSCGASTIDTYLYVAKTA